MAHQQELMLAMEFVMINNDNKMKENKYDRFFESVKSYVLETGLAYPEDLEGLSQDQIRLIEKCYGIPLPLALWSYLRFFGKKCDIINTDYYLDFSQKMIDYVMKEAQEEEHDVLLRIIDQTSIENEVDHIHYPVSEVLDLSKVLLTQFIAHNDFFVFIECTDENPLIQYFTKQYNYSNNKMYYSYHPGEWSFIGLFRHLLFEGISTKFFNRNIMQDKERINLYDRINLDKIGWSKCYLEKKIWYQDIKDSSGRYFYQIKQEFSKKIDVQAQETGIVMTIDEFEWAFIEHLRGLGVDI